MAQAFYAVRMMLLNFASGVPVSIWYDWKDDGDDSSDVENRYGLVRRNLEPKPAYRAIAAATTVLGGKSLACASDSGDGNVALVFGGGVDVTVVTWRESGEAPADTKLPPAAHITGSTDMFGRALGSSPDPPGVVYCHVQGVDAPALCGHLLGARK
jgi:hypothetical protein